MKTLKFAFEIYCPLQFKSYKEAIQKWRCFLVIKTCIDKKYCFYHKLVSRGLRTGFCMSYYIQFFIWCKIFIFNPGWKRCLWMPHALQYERQKWDEWSLLSGKTIILPFLTLFAAACTVNQNREFHSEIQNVFCILYD